VITVPPDPLSYRDRTYRHRIDVKNLVSYEVKIRETDLWICTRQDLSSSAETSALKYRRFIEEYIQGRPEFLTSFSPLAPDPLAPAIVQDMLGASLKARVGPMASVAGAIAQYVACDLLSLSDEVIVENGGDIYLHTSRDVHVGIFAGESPLSGRVRLKITKRDMPMGVCTSSGTVGHSISLGRADAVCVLSQSSVTADAAATAVGNMVQNMSDIKKALDHGLGIEGVLGVLIIKGDRMGVRGQIELC
jgi:ApbE superfamily uncharacterized protein (UPF0280 family)